MAGSLFGSRLDLAQRYAMSLATSGVERGLIGPREVPRLWDRHLLNCAVVATALESGAEIADVGTGAGLPGLVWAIARADVRMTLIEPLLRRTVFLEEVVADLGLDNVDVVRGRAEEVDGAYDVVTSRAVAPLPRLVGWSMPLVRPGGSMWAIKGASVSDEVPAARSAIRRSGGTNVRVTTYGEGIVETPTTVLQIDRIP
ncbi:UNVERIFIED_CONTAM: 16S rRNA methyltransferase [Mumia flava]|uniref:16S rRNA (guanine(527)-N(7))-methyltransferase RsmG n=1 Tax=Mumia flava TaxID=1348852 RepID=UPI000573DFC2|nr:16S rRNA (guanine(527)-N(7))-methyltransferase RsmG [Mumia flava]